MKTKVALFTTVLLILAFVSQVAFCEPYVKDASDYFMPMYISDGDLGDESVPMVLLYVGAALVAVSAIIVHQKRKCFQ